MTPTLRTLNAEIDRCDQTEIEREQRLKVLADFMLRMRKEILEAVETINQKTP